ncbi:MAG TPA: tetratricopeptide repeat protein [Flavobacterium sp.]|nr:tetratricopeptide repeat protein [Flavobacterium sp.]
MKNIFLLVLLFVSLFSNAQKKEDYEKFVDSMIQIGQREKLIPHFQKKLNQNPKNELTLRMLGFLHIKNNELEISEKYYRKALSINPKCGICYSNIGRIYTFKNNNTKAAEYFNKGILAEPNNPKTYIDRAEFRFYANDKIGALNDYNKAIALGPNYAELYVARAKFNSEENYLTLAMIDYNKAIELEPNNYSHYLARSEVFFNQMKTKDAFKDINKAIELNPKQESSYTARGTLYFYQGDFEKAHQDYSKGIELQPKGYFAYFNRSKVKYKLEDMNGSCDDLSESLKLLKEYEPENDLVKEMEGSIANYCDDSKPSYFYQRGIAYYNLGKFDDAVAIYTKGLEKFPTNAMCLSFRGNAYYESKNYEKAIADYNASNANKENLIADIEQNKNNTGLNESPVQQYADGFVATNNMSAAQSYFGLGKYEEALAEIEKGIKIAPDLKEFGLENYYNVRGTIYMEMGEYQKAISDFDKCLQLKMSLPVVAVNRAIAKINLKKGYKVTSQHISGGYNGKLFNANWSFPLKVKVESSNANLLSALMDCNQAIKEDPNLGYAYYVRGEIKRLLNYDDFCVDLKKATKLDYPVNPLLMDFCK